MSKRLTIVIGVAAVGVMALGAQTASAATDQCLAANGELRMQKGTATCTATGTGSVAKVKGAGQTVCADAARAIASDALDYEWGYEWPTKDQWQAGQTYGRCWSPDPA